MSNARTALTDRIKDVLAGHQLHASMNICDGQDCTWRATANIGQSLHSQFRAHLASVLTDTLAAEIWRDGYAAAYGMARGYGHPDNWDEHAEPANPYVRQAGDE